MSTVNVDLLQRALNYITEHPDELDQSMWVVQWKDGRTTKCLAGHIVSLASEANWGHKYYVETKDCTEYFYWEDVPISEKACELIGIEAYGPLMYILFDETNSLKQLWHWAHYISGGGVHIPPQFDWEG